MVPTSLDHSHHVHSYIHSTIHHHVEASMTSPVEVSFASNANIVIFLMIAKIVEAMHNTSRTAPDVPNVE